ncbi:his operon leader peptide [Aeromonas hydrophila subsp. hydrophila ATCC 7966]|uniref:His operon leader peptide n=1 Tax=Aeromonas hydrophila subsp. hydrophila (strain ATCC 7966 / DSM 30187 / BCRC 13018 / CCUG 14551 / JCM 1027 / KCTC 2358 / NCIMB 9240 / NCTC 8049) TaxID=380703 RepID=A0KKC0_AERHH|nr:his operon leader peptide [Aeromonas hydrophila subsp. hydrophila ATCC 7966]
MQFTSLKTHHHHHHPE